MLASGFLIIIFSLFVIHVSGSPVQDYPISGSEYQPYRIECNSAFRGDASSSREGWPGSDRGDASSPRQEWPGSHGGDASSPHQGWHGSHRGDVSSSHQGRPGSHPMIAPSAPQPWTGRHGGFGPRSLGERWTGSNGGSSLSCGNGDQMFQCTQCDDSAAYGTECVFASGIVEIRGRTQDMRCENFEKVVRENYVVGYGCADALQPQKAFCRGMVELPSCSGCTNAGPKTQF